MPYIMKWKGGKYEDVSHQPDLPQAMRILADKKLSDPKGSYILSKEKPHDSQIRRTDRQ